MFHHFHCSCRNVKLIKTRTRYEKRLAIWSSRQIYIYNCNILMNEYSIPVIVHSSIHPITHPNDNAFPKDTKLRGNEHVQTDLQGCISSKVETLILCGVLGRTNTQAPSICAEARIGVYQLYETIYRFLRGEAVIQANSGSLEDQYVYSCFRPQEFR